MFRDLLVLLPVLLIATHPLQAQQANAAMEVVAAERAFADLAREAGTRAAFLEFLAPDGVVFRPGPVNGREAVAARPAGAGLLSWRPVVAAISAAGDLGYSTGPYQVRPSRDAAVAGSGYYVTLWRRQPDGSLRAVLDHGLPTKLPPDTAELLQLWTVDVATPASADTTDPAALDARLDQAGDAALVDPQVRTLAAGALHRGAADRAAVFTAARPQTNTLGQGIAASRDLAYTYGEYRWGEETGYYARIWRRSGGAMQLVVEVYVPAAGPGTR